MKKIFLVLLLTVLIITMYELIRRPDGAPDKSDLPTVFLTDTASFELRKGDILVRPNNKNLPGTCSIKNGRRYGHVALVTKGASGSSVEEALSKATVIEALFFDQLTRKFQFARKDQIREASAITSFGNRFKGIRYRLRMSLTDDQIEDMIQFLKNQLDGGYNLFSYKREFETEILRKSELLNTVNLNWHCATLIWEAFYLSAGIDIDANRGTFIYPADIIACRYFDLPGGRTCF
jgi:hypothetical protein